MWIDRCGYLWIATGILVSGLLALPGYAEDKDSGWINLFDGKTLNGWHISHKTGHGKGGLWTVEDGAITGVQDSPGSGGILVTDQEYGDYELEMEMNHDWGIDSGIFTRSSEDGKAYQVLVDYRDGGNVGGVYGEGIGGFQYWFPDYEKVYKKGEWNKIHIRIEGNPPHIQVWLNDVQGTDWKGDNAELRPPKGLIGLQLHGGQGYTDKKGKVPEHPDQTTSLTIKSDFDQRRCLGKSFLLLAK